MAMNSNLVGKSESNVLTATFKVGSPNTGHPVTCIVTESIQLNIISYSSVESNWSDPFIKFTFGKEDENKKAKVQISCSTGSKYKSSISDIRNLSSYTTVAKIAAVNDQNTIEYQRKTRNQMLRLQRFANQLNPIIPLGTESLEVVVKIITPTTSRSNTGILQKECILTDLNNLLDKRELTDFKFKVEGKEFPVHKAVLAARSPVMMTMFSGEFKEKRTGESTLTDVTSAAFEDFLRYLYTDSVRNLAVANHVIELLKMAHLYEVNGLRVICESELLRGLDENNSPAIFQYAHLYGCNQTLKAKSFNLIKSSFAQKNYEIPDSFVDMPLEVRTLIDARKAMEKLLTKGKVRENGSKTSTMQDAYKRWFVETRNT